MKVKHNKGRLCKMNKKTKEKIENAAKAGWMTYLIALVVASVSLAVINHYGLSADEQPEVTIVLVGIVIFFGVLVISAHHNHVTEKGKRKHATGTMRRAIAATVVMVYLITFSIITFGDFQDKTLDETQSQVTQELTEEIKKLVEKNSDVQSIEQLVNSTIAEKIPQLRGQLELELFSKKTLLGHFTTVTSLVIIFYFGSKAVESVFKKNGNSEVDKKKLKKSIDDAVSKIGSKPDVAKKSLEDLSKTLE